MKRFLPLGSVGRAGRASALLALLACLVPASAAALPDGRGWELVSPVDKNGGEITAAGEVFNGGVFQAAADGNAIAYSSATSFATGTTSAPPGSQYLSARGGTGWATANLNVPIFSGSYGVSPDGVPYQLFSPDLGRAILLNGRHCRAQEGGCPVANPPLAGTDAVAGYQNYYLRSAVGFEALIGASDVVNTAVDPADFGVLLAGSSPDLTAFVLETCAALTPGATEVPSGSGCDPTKQNLYRWAGGSLSLVNSTPGARLGAQAGAVSEGGSRIYFNNAAGDLYLREGAQEKLVAAASGPAAPVEFQAATAAGSAAYYLAGGGLWRYVVSTDTSTPITGPSEVVGVLGASPDGGRVFYLANDGLYTWSGGGATKIGGIDAGAAATSTYPPATGAARVSADGTRLVFVSSASLTGYNNADQITGFPDSEVFLYNAVTKALRCVSCRTNGTRPRGPSSIPGAYRNGKLEGATASYKPRVLSADGNRVFFDSTDALVAPDTNNDRDVYEWVSFGGSCTKAIGCVDLISSGRSEDGAAFVDASASGDDAFFVTDESLVSSDPGAFDLYDARVGGGFPQPSPPIPCAGDACQDLPSEPVDPALNTLVAGLGNPKVHYYKYRRPRAQGCKGSAAKKTKKCKKQARGKKAGKRGGR
jgi:hypothetical protein